MTPHPSFRIRYRPLVTSLLAMFLFASSASALLMRENGPEPIIVQIKNSLRTSDDLDNRLNQFAALRQQNRLKVEKWWAKSKLLVMLSFPSDFTEAQALSVIGRLQESPAVEKVVAVSAQNLEFTAGDLEREYGPGATIPEIARRGFDVGRSRIGDYRPPDEAALLRMPHAPNRLIVRWKEEYIWKADQTGFAQQLSQFHQNAGCRIVKELRRSPIRLTQVLEFDESTPAALARKLRHYMDSGWVLYAQPDYIYELSAVPNDPAYSATPGPQWGLQKISAPQAWNLTTGNGQWIIAVGDTGANVVPGTGHPDFLPNLWSGQNNGGIHNFVATSTNVTDDNVPPYGGYHGSNVAAIIGAQGNNGAYMSGVAWNTSLMILKVADFRGRAFSFDVAEAIEYAGNHGAVAINLSLGFRTTVCERDEPTYYCYGGGHDPNLLEALKDARDDNLIVVSAAGNDGGYMVLDGTPANDLDDDKNSISPTSIPTDNNISVLATMQNDNLAGYSNFGANRVDLGAPGGIPSQPIIGLKQTYNASNFTDNFSKLYGTSMAAPHVAGALSLIKSLYPWENYRGLRDRVLMGTDRTGTLEGLCRTNGRLNVYKALQKRSMLLNLSTRARVEGGDRKMIGGFTIGSAGSTGTLKMVIRSMGPSLVLSVPRLSNPKITLNNSAGIPIRVQNNSGVADYAAPNERSQIQAFGLLPSDSREPAMLVDLVPGAYTLFVDSENGQYGVATFEIYEVEGNSDERARLVNLSTRCIVGTGQEEPIAGMIIGALADTDPLRPDRRLLMFGKGPSLSGLQGALANPQLQILTTGESNDNWQNLGILTEEVVEANLQPTNTQESLLWRVFRPGVYTVSLRGVNQTTGIGIIEMYEY